MWAALAACVLALSAATTASAAPVGSDGWLKAGGSHFWDCSGGSCDAKTLQPWDESKYIYSSQYAPLVPTEPVAGEHLWMTAAVSDSLAKLLGGSSDDAGAEGCGKCFLVRNAQAVNADWTALVMKKNRCPPWSNGCEEGKLHIDLAVPAFDDLRYSTANTCGSPQKGDTFISKANSGMCGQWYNNPDPTTAKDCDCSKLPSDTVEQKLLKTGCELFTQWNWTTTGAPQLDFKPVACPDAYVRYIDSAFGPNGPIAPQSARR